MPNAESSWPRKIRAALENVLPQMDAPAVLFSGGLDTSVLAYLASRRKGLMAVTVAVPGRSEDETYAARAAKEFGLTHVWVRPDFDNLLGILPQTIRMLKTFDPMTVRNSVALHVGLLMLKELHVTSVLTGDGADELFAGYSFALSHPMDKLPTFLRRLWRIMHFSSLDLGRHMDVDVQTPYLHPAVRELAEKVPPEALIAEHGGRKFGKALLRQAFEGEISEDLLWREKCPLEMGSGTTGLTSFFGKRFTDGDFSKEAEMFLKADGVRLRDKEHLHYYKLYRSQFGPPLNSPGGAARSAQRRCPDCKVALADPATDFCRLCGAWPVP
ncbi:MAG: hypothetical protein HY548_06165 [Elusimicrobia bacterium]|nr:hypothetical protein [Elusimicrobiota bacterium]